MLIAAYTTGGHSTLDLVLGIAILLWALASVSVLLGWLTRLPRRYRTRQPTTASAAADSVASAVASASVATATRVTPRTRRRR